jgi:hypothetical protein
MIERSRQDRVPTGHPLLPVRPSQQNRGHEAPDELFAARTQEPALRDIHGWIWMEVMEGTITTTTRVIKPEMLSIVTELDEFKGCLASSQYAAAAAPVGLAARKARGPCAPASSPRPEASRGTPAQHGVVAPLGN